MKPLPHPCQYSPEMLDDGWTWDDTLAEMRRGAKLLGERAKLQADGPLPPDTGRSPERRRRAVRRKA